MIGETPRPLAQSPVRVLHAGADDLDAVMDIMAAAFPPDYGEAWTRSQCAGILPMPGVALRLAFDARGQLAGFSLMRIVADEAELLLIAVKPKTRQQGIGRTLIEDFIASATGKGAHRLHLEVRDGNRAVELYERAGFALAGRRRDYYRCRDGRAIDALTLVLVA